MAAPTLTYTLTNGSTADATQVMQDLNDLLNGITDGTKDLSISALTCAGTATLNGHVNLGNSSADDLTITASLASTLAIKTNNTYNIGSATLGLAGLYLGNGGAGATCKLVSASHATTRTYTVPDCSAAASFVMTQATQTIDGVKHVIGVSDGSTKSAGYIGEILTFTSRSVTTTATGSFRNESTAALTTLTAGSWLICGRVEMGNAASTSATAVNISTNQTNDGSGMIMDSHTIVTHSSIATSANGWIVPMALTLYRVSGSTAIYPKVYNEDSNHTVTVAGFAIRIY